MEFQMDMESRNSKMGRNMKEVWIREFLKVKGDFCSIKENTKEILNKVFLVVMEKSNLNLEIFIKVSFSMAIIMDWESFCGLMAESTLGNIKMVEGMEREDYCGEMVLK